MYLGLPKKETNKTIQLSVQKMNGHPCISKHFHLTLTPSLTDLVGRVESGSLHLRSVTRRGAKHGWQAEESGEHESPLTPPWSETCKGHVQSEGRGLNSPWQLLDRSHSLTDIWTCAVKSEEFKPICRWSPGDMGGRLGGIKEVGDTCPLAICNLCGRERKEILY